jgi:hypothetical protein
MDGDRRQRLLRVCDKSDMLLVNSLQPWGVTWLKLLDPEEDDGAVVVGCDRPSLAPVFGSFIGLNVRFTDSDVR